MTLHVAAVDFGASSVRVSRVDLDASPPGLDVVMQEPHVPVRDGDGHLRWDWDRLVATTMGSLERIVDAGAVASIGISTWGVDYGLLDRRGRLIAPPFSYRDDRTRVYRDLVTEIGAEQLYEISGLQLQPFNTIFQLAVHDREELAAARHLLMLPELLVHYLTGAIVGEYTTAGTTGLLDMRSRSWSQELVEAAGVGIGLFPEIFPATTEVGRWRGVPVHLVGGHDTASAVVAMGPTSRARTAFVSSGTWLLVGREQPNPDTSEWARRANFSNELGALGDVRFLRNVAGFWLLEECRRAWGSPAIEELLIAAESVDASVPVFDASDERFLAPEDMEWEVKAAASLPPDARREVVVRTIIESMAATVGSTLTHFGDTKEVVVFGGGTRTAVFLEALSRRTGLPVRVGPAEATTLGNALVQGIALGRFSGLGEARNALREAVVRETEVEIQEEGLRS